MPLVRWKLFDPATEVEVDFPINPREGGRPKRTKTMTGSTATQGGHVRFQGRDAMPTATFSGAILTEQHDKFLNDWYDIQNRVRITNHLGQQFWAVLVDLDVVPRNRVNNPWSATYTAIYEHHGWIVQYPGIT